MQECHVYISLDLFLPQIPWSSALPCTCSQRKRSLPSVAPVLSFLYTLAPTGVLTGRFPLSALPDLLLVAGGAVTKQGHGLVFWLTTMVYPVGDLFDNDIMTYSC